ncbi:polysaccharide lyase family 8 super-sandwich domain-containing protein [Bacillus sp. FSL K6-3431]|uniref:polysaccharide lyase family 8 super-sandwich domain-containing protein n=1 Tax=Bacillus sp. FSL K6-3431 TaxID=2921500 RepID=UPI0030F54DC8
MKKTVTIFLGICLIFGLVNLHPAIFVSAEGGTKDNQIVNGNFEKTIITKKNIWANNVEPDGWGVWIPSGKPQLSIDHEEYREGSQSIRIDAPTNSRADVLQDVPIIPGSNYKFKVWIKTDKVEASLGGVFVRTQYLDNQGKKISDGPSTDKLTGTNGWALHEMNVPAPENASRLRIELFLETATGTVWFDDVNLEETDEVFLSGFALKQSTITMEKGESISLTPLFTPETATDKTVFWESTDSDVALVDDQGNVTAKDNGYATIKATTQDGGYISETLISVESPETIQAYNEVRLNWFNKLTGNDLYDPEDADVAAYISNLNERITNSDNTGRWDTLNKSLDRDFLWDFLQSKTDSSQISHAFGIIRDMAMAYSIKGSKLYHHEELRDDIIGALEWMYDNRYNERKKEYGNWWDWEIGTPQILNNIVVLMYDDLTSLQIANYMGTIDQFVPDPTKRVANSGVTETGANLLDKALVVTLRGVIGKSGAKINQGSDSIGDEFRYVDQGDGVYKDGSLVQHSVIAYTGSYGSVWVNRAADMLYLLRESPWAVTDPNVNNVYNWVTDSFESLIYKGAMMDMVRGRAISRENERDRQSGKGTILSLLRLAEAAPPEKELLIKQMVKEWIEEDSVIDNYAEGLPIYEMNLVKSLINDSSIKPRGELIKNQVFAGMDRVVHLRQEFGFGISMFSNRISAFSYGNGENKKGWHTGTGMTYLYNDDLTHYSNDFWPTVDSERLPGTTTDRSKGTLQDWRAYHNPKTWVGGSSMDGIYGAAGIDFSLEKSTGSTLQGKKSWFMFDNEVVAIGSGITSTDNRQVETIIENRQLNDSGDDQLMINGKIKSDQLGWSETVDEVKWAHLEGKVSSSDIGYFFPGNSEISGLRESRTGSWNDINNGGSKTPVTRNYLSLAVDHGLNPEAGAYSYILLPNKNAEATERYSLNPDVTILSDTSDLHAVKEDTLGITAANFWNAGTVDIITSDNPASVMVREENGEVAVAVSDPTQRQKKVTIELDKAELSLVSQDDTVDVLQTSPTLKLEINVASSIGKTHIVRFKDTSDPELDKRVLEELLETAAIISNDNGEYTEKSYESLQQAIKLTEEALESSKSQEDLDTAVKVLQTAVDWLVPAKDISVSWLLDVLEEYKEDLSEDVTRALNIHLTAVARYEEQEVAKKVVKHMESFKLLLDQQKRDDLISEKAYNRLLDGADSLIMKWQ